MPDKDRTLGIIGGISWVSSMHYYQRINEAYGAARGGRHSPSLLMASVNFQPVVRAQARGDWDAVGAILVEAAQRLHRGGAHALLIASNTMHKSLQAVTDAVALPALDIFDATATAVGEAGMSRIGLLGTRYTMADPFFREAYAKRGVEIVIPNGEDAARINEIIFHELVRNEIRPESREIYLQVVEDLRRNGAQGVILGCTEIGMLLKQEHTDLKIFDTTELHSQMAARWLSE